MLRSTARIDELNEEANSLFGEILHGRATLEQIATFERVRLLLQAELVGEGDLLSIDPQASDAWYDSNAARDYLCESEA